MNKHTISIDKDNRIISAQFTFDYTDDDIFISESEYETAKKYSKFDPLTREFSGSIKVDTTVPIEENELKSEIAVISRKIVDLEKANAELLFIVAQGGV